MIEAPAHEAKSFFDAGDFERSREAALRGLSGSPDDANLLRLAGRASAELGREDAVQYLERAVELEPENPDAFRDLAEALLFQNRLSDAMAAIEQAIELRPDDVSGFVDLGHGALATGRVDDAISHFKEAAERDPGSVVVRRALIDAYRATGRTEEALRAAETLLQLEPDDVLATLDAAELNLALGRWDTAAAEYSRLITIDDEPEHVIYAYHGMINAEMRAERWRRALDLAIEATRVDRYGRTTDLLAFVVTQVFGTADRPAPSRGEIDEELAASQAEHRRLHSESLDF